MYCITIIKLYICPKPIKIKSMKQSFTIPDGCTTVTVEQIENKLIATFEAKFIPQEGDFVTQSDSWIYIFHKLDSTSYGRPTDAIFYHAFIHEGRVKSVPCYGIGRWSETTNRLATESEKQQLLDALAKDGKKWNAELKRVEKLRWRAKYGEWYEYLNTMKGFPNMEEAMERGDDYDNGRYNSGNYFKICKSHTVADRINAIFAENL